MSKTAKMTAKELCINSMLAAMCAVLGYLSIDTGNLKITLESVPIIIGAALYGPVCGIAVGGIGTLVYQLLRYGLMVTTPLWMLPYCVCGLIVGLYAKRKDFDLDRKELILICVIAELVVTTLNTGVLYVDSRIYGYTVAYVFATIVPRYIICVVKAVAVGAILPPLIRVVKDRRA